MRRSALFLLALLALPLPLLAAAEPVVIYLTRHAEKGLVGQDPDLTAQGTARAHQLAAMLRSAGITRIYSTATRRTHQTAQPLAARLGLTVQEYDAGKPGQLIEQVKAAGGAQLLVGHSNTVPELVRLLGGTPGRAIADDEFDRLYQLTIAADGSVSTNLLHSVRP